MKDRYRAALMSAPRRPIEVAELPAPGRDSGGVLVRTVLSEVCGTDVHLHHGRLAGVPYPIIPGHVSVGVILDIRDEVSDLDGRPFVSGDTVAFLDVHESCGACHACLVTKQTTRCPSRKVYGITCSAHEGLLGGWAEAIWLKRGVKLLRLPAGVDAEVYCAGGCGLVTAVHAVERARIGLCDTVVVLGAGPVGQSVTALAALSGADRVITIGAPETRLAFATRMGATHTVGLDHSESERLDAVIQLTSGHGADVVVEASGTPAAVSQALDMVRDGGRVVVAGQYTDNGPVTLDPHVQINKKHVEIAGCWGCDYSHFHKAIAILARHQRRIPWREMITAKFGLDRMNEALAAVENREVLKAAVDPRG